MGFLNDCLVIIRIVWVGNVIIKFDDIVYLVFIYFWDIDIFSKNLWGVFILRIMFIKA